MVGRIFRPPSKREGKEKELLESERADRVTAPVINTFFDHLAEVKEVC